MLDGIQLKRCGTETDWGSTPIYFDAADPLFQTVPLDGELILMEDGYHVVPMSEDEFHMGLHTAFAVEAVELGSTPFTDDVPLRIQFKVDTVEALLNSGLGYDPYNHVGHNIVVTCIAEPSQ